MNHLVQTNAIQKPQIVMSRTLREVNVYCRIIVLNDTMLQIFINRAKCRCVSLIDDSSLSISITNTP